MGRGTHLEASRLPTLSRILMSNKRTIPTSELIINGDGSVFHLHLRLTGDNDELYFRDYLCDHPEDAENYQLLKLSLWKKFEYNRDAYTDAKGDFIKRCTDLAHLAYGDRYATRTRETD